MYSHNLDPIAFEIFNLKIYWYSLSYFFGFAFSFFYAKFLIKKKIIRFNFSNFEDFLGWAILSVILGGRIGYILFYNFNFYLYNPADIFKIWQGGMSFHGGLTGLILSIFVYTKIKNTSFLELSNLVSACAPFGIFLGRIANFINGELIGRTTNQNWGVLYYQDEYLRHPSQIYEAICEGLLIFLIINFFFYKNYQRKINIFAVFLLMYGFFRFFLEFLREPDAQIGFVLLNFTMGQILSFPMIILGVIFLKKKYEKN